MSRTRHAAIVGLMVAALLLAWTPSAGSADFTTKSKWRNCDTTTSAISIRAKFIDPVRYYGKGKYMVKRWVTWEYYKGAGQWRKADRHYTESSWLKITNPQYDYVTTAADRTKWLGLYDSSWRAHVTIKLIKNRPGPRDKKVEQLEIFPRKGSFREIGGTCGHDF